MIEANPGLLYEMGVFFHHVGEGQVDSAIRSHVEVADAFTSGGIGDKPQRKKAKDASEEAVGAIRRARGLHNRAEQVLTENVEILVRLKRESVSASANPVLAARADAYGTTAYNMVTAALQEHGMKVQHAYENVVETNAALLPELQQDHPVPPAI
ncbi:hypothetical protein A2971_00340 [Candidatus Gottesmanbacteria bacterium RIFCSPLOWO2_01_FULL_46_21]|uniref:Uncharacterized protein n=1 Tax=Candidatus Gottesmanbacteria bacterium RIFCSPLOWO2_01_FULL_46_21 TaxID=1798393 RepID=A0A1F6AWX9_9BACT|nr:MAG: hypothetical protein A2971_00340 [Candidatus Gottesmanbacteria bacterium RIFCSPLOWO2_01_FULL_46_21]